MGREPCVIVLDPTPSKATSSRGGHIKKKRSHRFKRACVLEDEPAGGGAPPAPDKVGSQRRVEQPREASATAFSAHSLEVRGAAADAGCQLVVAVAANDGKDGALPSQGRGRNQKRLRQRLRALRGQRPAPDAMLPRPGRVAGHSAGALKALCDLRTEEGAIMLHDGAAAARLGQRAAALLEDVLGVEAQQLAPSAGGSSSSGQEESTLAIVSAFHAQETAIAVTDAMLLLCEGDADAARREFQQLRPALRRNPELRRRVLEAGPLGAEVLALEDRREWATPELRTKRRRWVQEAIKEVLLDDGMQQLLERMSRVGKGQQA